MKNKINFPIDVVYLWVNGNDPEWIAKKNRAQKNYSDGILKTDAAHSARFIDSDELKYSIRSVEKYAPWINKIFIVTDNQIPEWLNIDNPKIAIIDHKTIFKNEGKLPNFNSPAIESLIFRIPDLSEHFLYFNDDFFLGNKVSPELFFTPEGKAKYPVKIEKTKNRIIIPDDLSRIASWRADRINAKEVLLEKYNKIFPYKVLHTIRPFVKEACSKAYSEFEKHFEVTINNQFRLNNIYSVNKTAYNVSPLLLFGVYMIENDYGEINILEHTKFLHNCKFYYPRFFYSKGTIKRKIEKKLKIYTRNAYYTNVLLGEPSYKKMLFFIKLLKPKQFCINDNEKFADETSRLYMKQYLKKYFKKRSRFEK